MAVGRAARGEVERGERGNFARGSLGESRTRDGTALEREKLPGKSRSDELLPSTHSAKKLIYYFQIPNSTTNRET